MLAVEAQQQGWSFFEAAEFAGIVGEPAKWSVDKDRVTIMFDTYSIAAYAAGQHDCRLSYADLKDLLKPGGVLPPK
jgi:uncharacterized protein DUF3298